MRREDARTEVKRMLPDYLRQKGINIRQNFRCLNPEHNDSNPSMSYDARSNHVHCFACQAHYDLIDLIGIDYGLTDDRDKFQKAYDLFGISVDRPAPSMTAQYQKQAITDRKKREAAQEGTQDNIPNTQTQYTIHEVEYAPKADFTAVLEEAHQNLLATPAAMEHYRKRGLSEETIRKYKLGFLPAGHNSALQAYPQYQCKSSKAGLYQFVFPCLNTEDRATYFITEISDREQVDKYNDKYRKLNNMDAELYNERYLRQPPETVYLCEGVYDALAVEEMGEAAIAFLGTSRNRFLGLCKKYKPDTTFIIVPDNDEAGQKAAEKIKEGLDVLGIPYIEKPVPAGKDLNDALVADRQAFKAFVEQATQEAIAQKQKAEQEARDAYMAGNAEHHLQGFIDSIEKSKTATYYSTGFQSLDKILDGGLYAGLYCLGAISSLGKTSLCLQIMDNIAAAGNDVIIFSLEMSQYELMAKTISRHTLLEDLQKNGTTIHAKTVRGITTGKRYENYSNEDRKIIAAAVSAYQQYAGHVFIREGVGNIGTAQIRQAVCDHVLLTGRLPVICLDYAQILSPESDRLTDKQATDRNILELKRLSRDYGIPVIAISSLNRDNYTAPINMASYKESGAIEYSSDVLIGLQYEGMDYQPKENDKDRKERVSRLIDSMALRAKRGLEQNIQVKVLKNRNGGKGEAMLQYFPMFNYFTELDSTSGKAIISSRAAKMSEGSGTGGGWQVVSSTAKEATPFDTDSKGGEA